MSLYSSYCNIINRIIKLKETLNICYLKGALIPYECIKFSVNKGAINKNEDKQISDYIIELDNLKKKIKNYTKKYYEKYYFLIFIYWKQIFLLNEFIKNGCHYNHDENKKNN